MGAVDGDHVPLFHYAELFAGLGGFSVALKALGGRCVFASEIEGSARTAWRRNFTDCELSGDITAVDAASVPDHDMLVGGFPCQPFSRAGTQPAMAVDKGNLYMDIVRVLRAKRPRLVLLENVPGLSTAADGAALQTVLDNLEGCGYDVTLSIVDSRVVVPQKRKRLYIVAFRRDTEPGRERGPTMSDISRFAWPLLPDLSSRSLESVLEDHEDDAKPFRITSDQWRRRLAIADDPQRWLIDLRGPGPTLTKGYRRPPGRQAGKRQAARNQDKSYMDWMNLVLRTDASLQAQASPAVDAAASDVPRYLTARECARMHGFPETFVIPLERSADGPGIALFGNAVSPPVVLAIAHAMLTTAGLARLAPLDTVLSSLLLSAVPARSHGALAAQLAGAEWKACAAAPRVSSDGGGDVGGGAADVDEP
jgi:DNA (cytosine-5)-methyltransferase 1